MYGTDLHMKREGNIGADNAGLFVPLELCEEDQRKIEEYFLSRSSLPFKSLEMSGGVDMTLEAKVTGALEMSHGSIQALAPIICTANESPSPSHGACVIDGVLNYCKRLSSIKSKHQLSKTFTKAPDKKILEKKMGQTFDVSPNAIRSEAKLDLAEVSPSGQNPLFCSTPAAPSGTVLAKSNEELNERIKTAQRSKVMRNNNKGATCNSSILIRSRRSMHWQESCRPTMGKENLKSSTVTVVEEAGSKRTNCSPHVLPVSSGSCHNQKHAKPDGFLLQFPQLSHTPKGRMSFQISGSVEWEN